jgi:hypothetical protein
LFAHRKLDGMLELGFALRGIVLRVRSTMIAFLSRSALASLKESIIFRFPFGWYRNIIRRLLLNKRV